MYRDTLLEWAEAACSGTSAQHSIIYEHSSCGQPDTVAKNLPELTAKHADRF